VSLHDVKNYLNTPELAKVVIAEDILHDSIPVVRPTASLTVALERFGQHDGERLPVVNDTATKRLIGTIAKTDVILALAGAPLDQLLWSVHKRLNKRRVLTCLTSVKVERNQHALTKTASAC